MRYSFSNQGKNISISFWYGNQARMEVDHTYLTNELHKVEKYYTQFDMTDNAQAMKSHMVETIFQQISRKIKKRSTSPRSLILLIKSLCKVLNKICSVDKKVTYFRVLFPKSDLPESTGKKIKLNEIFT